MRMVFPPALAAALRFVEETWADAPARVTCRHFTAFNCPGTFWEVGSTAILLKHDLQGEWPHARFSVTTRRERRGPLGIVFIRWHDGPAEVDVAQIAQWYGFMPPNPYTSPVAQRHSLGLAYWQVYGARQIVLERIVTPHRAMRPLRRPSRRRHGGTGRASAPAHADQGVHDATGAGRVWRYYLACYLHCHEHDVGRV